MRIQKVFLLTFVFLVGCNQEQIEWAETVASISNVEQIDKTPPSYAYMISYDVAESTAVDEDNKPINGPIEQHGFLGKKPVNDQKIKLRYRRDEPLIFELQEEMKFD